MRREIFEAAIRSTIPESALLTEVSIRTNGRPKVVDVQRETYKAPPESGTTVLAFHFNEGIMLAGDRQTSGWFSIISQESVKIHKIGNYSGFMFAGMVSDGQMVVNSLRRVERDFLNKFGMPLSLDGLANYLTRFVRLHYNHGVFLEAWGIIAGLNLSPPEFKIYSVEPTGSKIAGDFITTGSGGDRAEAELEKFRGKIRSRSLEAKEAIELAVRAIYMAGKKDMGTSDVRLALPLVAVISIKGFHFVIPKKIEEICNTLLEQERTEGNVS